MSIPQVIARLTGTTSAGAPSLESTTCRLVTPPRRSVGLFGDVLVVVIPYNGVGSDWDLAAPFLLSIGEDLGGVFTGVTLGGYYLRQRREVAWGEDPSTGVFRFHEIELVFVTLPGVLRDGRGGLLTAGTLNRTDRTGRVDTSDPGYATRQALVDLCLDALGVPHDPCPAGINTPVDGVTTIHAPGPLDWGLTRALPEIEQLLADVGWAATLANLGDKIVVHRLRRGGETITLPPAITADAEPYSPEVSSGLRPSRIVVTSGRTRTTVITDRSLDSAGAVPLEWVAFDARSGQWLNGAEWTAAYPAEVGPGDIAFWREGPGGADRSVEDLRAFDRMFTALRLHADDRPGAAALVTLSESVNADGDVFGGTPAVLFARYCVDQGGGTFVNEPGDADPLVRLDGVRAVPGEGVFILPTDATFVRMSPGPNGGHADADALGDTDLRIVFAHESARGDWARDYYASGWEVSTTGGVVSVTQMNASALAAAIADDEVVTIEAPWLRRVVVQLEGDVSETPLNDAALDAVAKQLALARVGADLVTTFEIEVRGIRAIEPGDAEGAVSAVEWDLAGNRTRVFVNTHETPGAEFDRLEAAARRSVAAGLGRFSLAGSSAGTMSSRAGSTPGETTTGAASAGGAAAPEATSGLRGRERAAAGRPVQGESGGGLRRATTRSEASSLWAEILDYTEVAPNVWHYQWREVRLGGGGWAAVANGRDYLTHGVAINTIEAPNDGVGLEGNGVDMGNLVGTFAMRPVGTGAVVLLRGPYSLGGGATRMVFSAVNQVDGECGGAS